MNRVKKISVSLEQIITELNLNVAWDNLIDIAPDDIRLNKLINIDSFKKFIKGLDFDLAKLDVKQLKGLFNEFTRLVKQGGN